MGMCKANRGNLMQHWVLCEMLDLLQDQFDALHFVTTHSMSPWAMPVKKEPAGNCRSVFVQAGNRLGQPEARSRYEQAWQRLSVNRGLPYPSSAAFASEVWKGRLSAALCEANPGTADEIEGWLFAPQQQQRLWHSVVLRGDWRSNLSNPLLLERDARCVYFEMDPMRYDTRNFADRKSLEPATLYPDDVNRLVRHLPNDIPMILQISSFSTQNNIMPVENQRRSLVEILEPAGFGLYDSAQVTTQMATFVFTRQLQLKQLQLGGGFADWLRGIA